MPPFPLAPAIIQHNFKTFKEPMSQFQEIDSPGGQRYDNPIPTRFLATIDCSKIPAPALSLHYRPSDLESYCVNHIH
jgi:hypothetical protein